MRSHYTSRTSYKRRGFIGRLDPCNLNMLPALPNAKDFPASQIHKNCVEKAVKLKELRDEGKTSLSVVYLIF